MCLAFPPWYLWKVAVPPTYFSLNFSTSIIFDILVVNNIVFFFSLTALLYVLFPGRNVSSSFLNVQPFSSGLPSRVCGSFEGHLSVEDCMKGLKVGVLLLKTGAFCWLTYELCTCCFLGTCISLAFCCFNSTKSCDTSFLNLM